MLGPVRLWVVARLALALALVLPCSASSQVYEPPRHTAAPSPLLAAGSDEEIAERADSGTQVERDRDPVAELEEHRKLAGALATLAAHRPGTVDAYVVAIALDSDPVFGREARAAGEVLARRYDAHGRTIVLAGSDGSAPSDLPRGSPASLDLALARIAELIDPGEDVLVFYSTSHGAPFGLYYNDGDSGYGAISPVRLRDVLDRLDIRNRLLILSACHSGVFVPALRSPTTAILTAAAADRTSFGCAADNDWTFFGDALVNRALRRPQPLAAAFDQATALVSAWETQVGIEASRPQIALGDRVATWLRPLEDRMPSTPSRPTGRPAIETTLPPRVAGTRK